MTAPTSEMAPPTAAQPEPPRPPRGGVLRRLLRLPVTIAGKPLTLAQVLSSASGAVAMLIAAWAMAPGQFSTFALLTLVSATMTGLLRSALLQPALIQLRHDKRAFVPLRYALVGSVIVGVVFLGAALYLRFRDPVDLIALSVSALVPALYDWLRFKAMGQDRRWPVAQADGIRFVAVLVTLALPAVRENAVAMQAYLSLSVALPAALLIWRLPRTTAWVPYRDYRKAARWQVVDFMFGQTLITLPLLALGGTAEAALIAGIRLAQSILGPLNLMFSAGTTNLVADGATRAEFATAGSLIARGAALGRLLCLTSVACVAALIGFFQVSSIPFNGVRSEDVLLGLALVGGSLITTGWAGVHAIVLRLLNHQAAVSIGRAVIAAATVAGFVLGYVLGGTNVSLIAGFATLAASAPLVFYAVARPRYRRARESPSA